MHNGRMFRQFIYALKFSEEDFKNIFISGIEKHSVGTPKMVLDIRGKMFKNEIFNRQCETRVWSNFVYGDKYYDYDWDDPRYDVNDKIILYSSQNNNRYFTC